MRIIEAQDISYGLAAGLLAYHLQAASDISTTTHLLLPSARHTQSSVRSLLTLFPLGVRARDLHTAAAQYGAEHVKAS